MLVVQQETTAKYRNGFVFHLVQALENDSASGNQSVGVVSVRCRHEVSLAHLHQDFKITADTRDRITDTKKIFKEFFLKTTHRQSMSMEVSLLLQTLF